jgi:TRAP-type mannitol/chloroaromatic compound transport system permease large subunit
MYKGVLPFIALEFICLGLIMAFPDLALKLPELLFERVAKGTPY